MTRHLLRSSLQEAFELIHVDTTDRRDLNNLGRWDVVNVALALHTVWRFSWLCLSRQPQVVYIPVSQNTAGFVRDALLVLAGRALSRAKVIVHLHGSALTEFYTNAPLLMRGVVDFTMRRVCCGIVLGNSLIGQLSKWISGDRIAVVPNGAELAEVSVAKSGPEATVRFLFLGNLLVFKGVLDVVAAAAQVVSRHEYVEFIFAGRWTRDPRFGRSAEQTQAECEEIIGGCSNPKAFTFLGEIDRSAVWDALGGADVVILPSYDEGLPLVILEAMSVGLPVISSRGVGAIEEAVLDGETGLLVTPGNRKALADAMERLISDPTLRLRMGRAGAERSRAQFSMEIWEARMRRVFVASVGGEASRN